jgi:hypothetical protein
MMVPRTATIDRAAMRGKRLRRNGGREYKVPRIADPQSEKLNPCVAKDDDKKVWGVLPMSKLTSKQTVTTREAAFGDSSPEAMTKYGLLILSMVTSVIWLSPVMNIFIRREGIVAYSILSSNFRGEPKMA